MKKRDREAYLKKYHEVQDVDGEPHLMVVAEKFKSKKNMVFKVRVRDLGLYMGRYGLFAKVKFVGLEYDRRLERHNPFQHILPAWTVKSSYGLLKMNKDYAAWYIFYKSSLPGLERLAEAVRTELLPRERGKYLRLEKEVFKILTPEQLNMLEKAGIEVARETAVDDGRRTTDEVEANESRLAQRQNELSELRKAKKAERDLQDRLRAVELLNKLHR